MQNLMLEKLSEISIIYYIHLEINSHQKMKYIDNIISNFSKHIFDSFPKLDTLHKINNKLSKIEQNIRSIKETTIDQKILANETMNNLIKTN